MCEQLVALSEQEFLDAINAALHNASDATFIGQVPQMITGSNFEAPPLIDKLSTKRFSFPLANTHATSYAAERLALIGDAAHRVHPLAGQGLNIGLTDVAYLANEVLKACKSGQDIGSYDFVLQAYESKAKVNTDLTVGAIEIARQSYSPKMANTESLGHVLAVARNIGVDLINASDFVKQNLMHFSSGTLNHPAVYEWTSP